MAQRTKAKYPLPKITTKTTKPKFTEDNKAFPGRVFNYGEASSISAVPQKKLLPARLKKFHKTSQNREVKREIRAWAVPTISLATPRSVTLPAQRKPTIPPAPKHNSMENMPFLKSPQAPLSPVQQFKSLSPKLYPRACRSLSPIETCKSSERIFNKSGKSLNNKSALLEPKVIGKQTRKLENSELYGFTYPSRSIRHAATFTYDLTNFY